jgi:hypothetical protein
MLRGRDGAVGSIKLGPGAILNCKSVGIDAPLNECFCARFVDIKLANKFIQSTVLTVDDSGILLSNASQAETLDI